MPNKSCALANNGWIQIELSPDGSLWTLARDDCGVFPDVFQRCAFVKADGVAGSAVRYLGMSFCPDF